MDCASRRPNPFDRADPAVTIVAGTLAGLALFPQLDLWTAAAPATILAPTDAAQVI